MITAASLLRLDEIEGPKVEYSWTTTQERQNVFSGRGLLQLYTISTMNPSSIPRMIQYADGTCLISLRKSNTEGNTLLALLLNRKATPEAQKQLWKKLRVLHGRSKTVEKLSKALNRLVKSQQPS
ncbi:MAG: hypothetical protein ACXAB4_05855 [Candidatus Hodarchaeales archaeon]